MYTTTGRHLRGKVGQFIDWRIQLQLPSVAGLSEFSNRMILYHFGCLSFWCPCITFGQIAFARIEEGSTLLDLLTRIGFCCSMPCARSYLHSDRLVDRVRLLLLLLLPHQDETAIPAARESLRRLLSPFLLRICALTQEYCELEKCGFDMSIGRHKSPPFDQPARNDVPLEMPISRTI
ncbi:uncharacterized protein LOC104453674 isoform X3 [Eucalyptus grandis]|uniref:uncharacterized protein LOC104453674 isoform X3 n=1 Tax=Eucalyptus grandis TaxID=71139 RepID=UPI00192E8C32|nr:uncharacterized protein LOC104453674 isoform X3 [Eucalyptus grandis]